MADLRDLKLGDEVAIIQAYPRNGAPRVVTIERVTRTQIVADGSRWRRDDGRQIPREPWYRRRIVPATDEHRHAEERGELWAVIHRAFTAPRMYAMRHALSTDAMRTIAGALQADEARRDERG